MALTTDQHTVRLHGVGVVMMQGPTRRISPHCTLQSALAVGGQAGDMLTECTQKRVQGRWTQFCQNLSLKVRRGCSFWGVPCSCIIKMGHQTSHLHHVSSGRFTFSLGMVAHLRIWKLLAQDRGNPIFVRTFIDIRHSPTSKCPGFAGQMHSLM